MTYVSLAITAMAAAGASGTYVSEYVSDCQNSVASILVANGITISAVTKIQQCPVSRMAERKRRGHATCYSCECIGVKKSS